MYSWVCIMNQIQQTLGHMFKFKHWLQCVFDGCLDAMLNRDFASEVMFVCFTDTQPAMFSVKNKNILLMFYTEIAFLLQSFLLNSENEIL